MENLETFVLQSLFDPQSPHPHAKQYRKVEKFVHQHWNYISPKMDIILGLQTGLIHQTVEFRQRVLVFLLTSQTRFLSKMKDAIMTLQHRFPQTLMFETRSTLLFQASENEPYIQFQICEDFESLFWRMVFFPEAFPKIFSFDEDNPDLYVFQNFPMIPNNPNQTLLSIFRYLHSSKHTWEPIPKTMKIVFQKTIRNAVLPPRDNLLLRVLPRLSLYDFVMQRFSQTISKLLNVRCCDADLFNLVSKTSESGMAMSFDHRIFVVCEPETPFPLDVSTCLIPILYKIQIHVFAHENHGQEIPLKETLQRFSILRKFLEFGDPPPTITNMVRFFSQRDAHEEWHNPKVMLKRWAQHEFPASEIPFSSKISIPYTDLTFGQKQTLSFCKYREGRSFLQDVAMFRQLNADEELVCSPYFLTPLFTLKMKERRRYEACLRGGCIANETGSGKTLSALVMCDDHDMNLILVPSILHQHWISEIRKHTTAKICSPSTNPVSYPDEPYVLSIRRAGQLHSTSWPERQPWIVLVSWPSFRSVSWRRFVDVRVRQQGTNPTFHRMIVEEAHMVSKKVFQRILWTERKITWLLTATPYQKTNQLVEMLAIRRMEDSVCSSRCPFFPSLHKWFPYLFSTLTLQSKLHLEDVNVQTDVIFCPITPQEEAFFGKIEEIVRGSHRVLRKNMTKLNRFFRILERITSGGVVHAKLMLAILMNTFNPKRKLHVLNNAPQAEVYAICDGGPKSICSICYSPFENPRQLGCQHVFCSACLQCMLDMQMKRCALCRAPIKEIYLPLWKDRPVVSPATQKTVALPSSHAEFEVFLKGPTLEPEENQDFLLLNGKLLAFRNELVRWVGSRKPEDRLVIFIKEILPAEKFAHVLTHMGIRVLPGGILGTNQKTSVDNIEKFRHDENISVLFLSTRYCTGFDLACASDVWLLNTDLYTCKIEQSRGRVVRLSQQHPTVSIKVFLYNRTFGHFLWDMRHLGTFHYTKSNLLLFEFFLCRDKPTSFFGRVHTIAKRTCGESYHVSSSSKALIFNHVLYVYVDEMLVRCGHYRQNVYSFQEHPRNYDTLRTYCHRQKLQLQRQALVY